MSSVTFELRGRHAAGRKLVGRDCKSGDVPRLHAVRSQFVGGHSVGHHLVCRDSASHDATSLNLVLAMIEHDDEREQQHVCAASDG